MARKAKKSKTARRSSKIKKVRGSAAPAVEMVGMASGMAANNTKVSAISNFVEKFKAVSTPVKLGLFLGLAAVVLVVGLFKGLIVAAWVNGRPVFRYQIIGELEKQSGAQVLDSLVTQKLIEQEASRAGVSATAEEVNAEIAKLEDSLKSQGQDLEQLLALQGWTKANLEDQFRVQVLMEKMGSGDVSVSEEDIAKYLADNQSLLPTDKTAAELEQLARDQLAQQHKTNNIRAWLGKLQADGKVMYWVKYASGQTN